VKLTNAAKFFDDTQVYDAYTGRYLWLCQFSSFNDANAVGSTSTRRILSITSDLLLPTRRAVKIFDDIWLVGDGNPDSWKGSIIRQSFNMKKATALVALLTPAEACLSSAGVTAYAQAIYFKDTVNSLNNADYDPFWNYFFAPGEAVAKGKFIRDGSRLLRIRSSYLPLEDLRIAQSDEVDIGPVAAVFQTGAYVPATDTYATGTVSTFMLMFDFTKAYSYLTEASEKVATGDMNALVPKAALTPVVGNNVTISSVAWKIVGMDTESDCWLLHLRRA
jgi:hypothetical protein